MRTLLICHDEAILAKEGSTRWLASFSDLAGVIILREKRQRLWKRVRREFRRVGLRIFDVATFRLHYKLFQARKDHQSLQSLLADLKQRYAPVPADTPILYTDTPNSKAAVEFLQQMQPDVVIASCKQILKPKAFSVARTGTFALHPGICPEYRNAHGCFWALANNDLGRVGMTLLKIDAGIDTGPVYGYYTYDYDEVHESHLVIQRRMMLENLDAIAARLQEIHAGTAQSINTAGRSSGEWGQPWLTAYLRWKRAAVRRRGHPQPPFAIDPQIETAVAVAHARVGVH
ncbi:MAG: formyltransferase family protein [Planctomycetaceae bacterium]